MNLSSIVAKACTPPEEHLHNRQTLNHKKFGADPGFGFRWNEYFGAFEYLLLHCNTSRSRPTVRLTSLTFQADWLNQRRWWSCRRGQWALSSLVV